MTIFGYGYGFGFNKIVSSNPVLALNPVIYYEPSEYLGSGALLDKSIYGNNATASLYDYDGTTKSFNINADYQYILNCGNGSSLDNLYQAFTVCTWFKSNGVGFTQGLFDESSNGGGLDTPFQIWLASSKLQVTLTNGVSFYREYSNVLLDNTWYYAEIIWDGTNITVCTNRGADNSSVSTVVPTDGVSANWLYGGMNLAGGAGSFPFIGNLGSLVVFDYALDNTQRGIVYDNVYNRLGL